MEKATIIGIDLAKRVFQVHVAAKDGRPVLRKRVSRAQLLGLLAKQPPGRRLLIIGAMTVVRWAVRKGAATGSWLPECWSTSRDWLWLSPWPTRWPLASMGASTPSHLDEARAPSSSTHSLNRPASCRIALHLASSAASGLLSGGRTPPVFMPSRPAIALKRAT